MNTIVLRILAVFFVGLLIAGCSEQSKTEISRAGLIDLQVMQDNYPRAFFFRSAEVPGKNPDMTYEEWEQSFERLMGIEGKVLDEEIPSISGRNIPFFTKFKERHPDQFVLLHFNGNARDPLFDTGEYHASHWIYFNGATILGDVPAEPGETMIQVSDASLFKTGVGRYKTKNEDIGLCELDANGKPDWNKSEQVVLVSADIPAGTITVKRGAYGTEPHAFKAATSYAAAHVYEGPWGGESSNLMWFYNYSTKCPKDEQGRTAADILGQELTRRFSPGGELALFDGLEFDVLFFHNTYHPDLRRSNSGRGMDVDNDGKVDQAMFDGIDTYGAGVIEFCRQLRDRFPQDKLLLADGMSNRNQRAFQILNGIESEGFPHLNDITISDWSGGLNRHFFWEQNAREPVFNYINHKFRSRKPGELVSSEADVPFGIHRLAFAAGVFTDAAICYSNRPTPEPGEYIGLWDELVMGIERKLGWLGKPLGEAIRLAEQGDELKLDLKVEGGVSVDKDNERLKIVSKDSQAERTAFTLKTIPLQGPDLYVTMTLKAAPWKGYVDEVARLAWVGASNGQRFMTWANNRDFQAGFYFSEMRGSTTDLVFEIEGVDPLWISDLRAYAAPDAMYREFEYGVVLANPSPHPVEFDLEKLFPKKTFRRLQASSKQDTTTNDGSLVGPKIELPGKDALFLIRN